MLRKLGRRGTAPSLVLAATLLTGCTSLFDSRDWTVADAGSGGMFRAAWGGMRSETPESSATIQRIRGVEVPLEPLQLEPGSVWPVEEAPRATLANPDAALRGVPPYRPGEPRSPERLWDDGDRRRDPMPRAEGMPPDEEVRPAPPPPRRRGASSPPPPPLAQPAPERLEVLPIPPGANAPPPRRSDGVPILTPGGPVTTTGGTDRVQGFVAPGGGSGVIHRDGGVTTVIPSGGPPQSFPTPR
jgi:hypothetical protein